MTEARKDNKVCARVYINIQGELDSPLLIGSGEAEYTDMDILVTSDGTPFIPGSAFAGALRSYIEENMSAEDAENLFGTLGWGLREVEHHRMQPDILEYQSRIFVYDTLLKETHVTSRDGVRLDEYKTAEEKAKYNMQVVEKCDPYNLRLEILIRDREKTENGSLEAALDKDLERIRCCVCGMRKGNLRLGAKSNRGFGKLKLDQVKYQIFRMDQTEDFETWLNWDWESNSAFAEENHWDLSQFDDVWDGKEHCLRIPLRVRDTILIRKYGTDIWSDSTKTEEMQEADYSQLTITDGNAVIPGSTWAGAIRSYLAARIKEFGKLNSWEEAQKALEPFFGTWGDKESKITSCVIFDETKIVKGHKMPVIRNAVDRFTGGSAKKSLYKEILWADGETDLEIRWSERGFQETEQQVLCGMFLWVIYGLKNGLLAVGGETGVGRGIFEEAGIVSLDGCEITDSGKYLRAAANWCRHLKEE